MFLHLYYAIFLNWKTAWSIGPDLLEFGFRATLLQQGQTAVQLRAAGHGPVCFLSTVEFIWASGYKHMNGP